MAKTLCIAKAFIITVAIFVIAGCGKNNTGISSKKVKIPETGFTMNLPAGWTVDSVVDNQYYKKGDKENNWGVAKFCPMSTVTRKFPDVSSFATYMINEDRFDNTLKEVISQKSFKIGTVQANAYEVIFKTTKGNYVFNIFIEMKNGEAFQLFFLVSENQYETFSKQYPQVVKSICLTKEQPTW